MGKIKAVIFDMDGLMIDTEQLHLQAFNSVLNKHGKHLTEDENSRRYIGLSDIDEARDMVLRFDLPISAEQVCKIKSNVYKQLLKNQLVAKFGLIELLKNLKENDYKISIASSSNLDEIKTIIIGLSITSYIDSISSAEEVKNGKPAPDVYLLAAERLKVIPSECLVLEDAPKGIQAGKVAGMLVFAIPSSYTKGLNFSRADKVLNNLSEVFPLINLA